MMFIYTVAICILGNGFALAEERKPHDDSVCGKVSNIKLAGDHIGFDLNEENTKIAQIEILSDKLAHLALPIVLSAYSEKLKVCASTSEKEKVRGKDQEFAHFKAKRSLWLALREKDSGRD